MPLAKILSIVYNLAIVFIFFMRPGEAPPGYPLQVLARSSLWAFRYYPLPIETRNTT
jgi:hypothetical protein